MDLRSQAGVQHNTTKQQENTRRPHNTHREQPLLFYAHTHTHTWIEGKERERFIIEKKVVKDIVLKGLQQTSQPCDKLGVRVTNSNRPIVRRRKNA